MTSILQSAIPRDMDEPRALPGVQPVSGPWLEMDDAYRAQMARRVHLLKNNRSEVLYTCEDASEASGELLDEVLAVLPGLDFHMRLDANEIECPDGRCVHVDRNDPLDTLGQLVQCDFCLLDKVGEEHVLKAAVLCFPASWRLADKVERPLVGIHEEVSEYTQNIAARVQRLFDGVQVGRPVWRHNRLYYVDPELFQPRSASEPRREKPTAGAQSYVRAERQTIFRLPRSRWVVFAIHTIVVRA